MNYFPSSSRTKYKNSRESRSSSRSENRMSRIGRKHSVQDSSSNENYCEWDSNVTEARVSFSPTSSVDNIYNELSEYPMENRYSSSYNMHMDDSTHYFENSRMEGNRSHSIERGDLDESLERVKASLQKRKESLDKRSEHLEKRKESLLKMEELCRDSARYDLDSYRERSRSSDRRTDRSYSKERSRKNRSRSNERRRNRRSRSRERSRAIRMNRSHSRSRELSRENIYNSKEKDYSGRRHTVSRHSSEREDSPSYDDEDASGMESVDCKFLPNTVMIRGLVQHITEQDIRSTIESSGLVTKDIRLVRRKLTGTSRGFAFVEFNTSAEAQRWMDLKKGTIMIKDKYRAIMQYSIPREQRSQSNYTSLGLDWHCIKCGIKNFRRRYTCFKCSASRKESVTGGEGSDEISEALTMKLILRNLDVLSKEEDVLKALEQKAPEVVPSIINILIGRDSCTSLSRGICYISFGNVSDSMRAFNALNDANEPFIVNDKKVDVSYCNDRKTVQEEAIPNPSQGYTVADVPRLAEYSADLYATSPAEKQQFLIYYTNYYMMQIAQGNAISLPMSQTDQVNSAAAVAHEAIMKQQNKNRMLSAKQGKHSASTFSSKSSTYNNCGLQTTNLQIPTGTDGKIYSPPDASTFQYDSSSGYYYDAMTGLYYDPNTQYYYNSLINKFLYFNTVQNTFVLAAETTKGTGERVAEVVEEKKQEKSQDKVKVAKKIAKDMERWAKTLNQKKESLKKELSDVKSTSTTLPVTKPTADICYSALVDKPERVDRSGISLATEKTSLHELYETQTNRLANSTTIAYEKDHDSSGDENEDVDFVNLTCLLCKRAFPSKEVLQKHTKMSNLHKQNLALAEAGGRRKKSASDYRDRAKERRSKHVSLSPVKNFAKENYLKKLEELAQTSQDDTPPPAAPIDNMNVGNKMLQKMGWSEGQGLGRNMQGRTDIIETEKRTGTTGLGIAIPPSRENYKIFMKKMMLTRYNEGPSKDTFS